MTTTTATPQAIGTGAQSPAETPQQAAEAAEAPKGQGAPPVATTTPPAPTPATAEPTGNPWSDPEAAKAEIERLRRENGAARTNAKAQAAEDARKELANTIGKALGLVEDGTETDPAKLTASLTKSQAEAKQARVELAVFRAAAAAGGDPAALLDSQSFLKSLDGVDPSDSAAVTAVIQAAVSANARLGAASTDSRVPRPNPAQGASASQPTAAQQANAAAAAGDWGAALAIKADQVAQLMGGQR